MDEIGLAEDHLKYKNRGTETRGGIQKHQQSQGGISGTETPPSIRKKANLLSDPVTYQEVVEKVEALVSGSETALKIVLAIAVSANFSNPVMLWMLLVGVPSSGKTDLVRLVRDAEATFFLDNLTQNAFVTGERSSESNKVYDLLPLLDKKCLILKDWTAIFSLDEKMTKKLLGELVGIYDREFTKFSSRRGEVSYKSEFSQLGCITPATLNRHTTYMNMVGPRFLCYSMPELSSENGKKSYKQIFSGVDRSAIEKEARLYTSSYLQQLTRSEFNVDLTDPIAQEYIQTAAEFMSCARGIVILQTSTFKGESGEEIKYYEVFNCQVEEPWRAVQQLILLAKYLAFVAGHNKVGVDELTIIREVALSSMPADRAQALRSVKSNSGVVTAKSLSETSDRSTKTARRLLEELVALKIVNKIKGSGQTAAEYEINERFKSFVTVYTAEFLSPYSNSPEPPKEDISQSPSQPSLQSKTTDQMTQKELEDVVKVTFPPVTGGTV